MKVIHKYILSSNTMVPAGRILKVDFQRSDLIAWIEIDFGQHALEQTLFSFPTGLTFDDRGLTFVGTAVSEYLVYHVYSRG